MVFSSLFFIWIFLPIVFFGNLIFSKFGGVRASNIFLLIFSLLFYSWGEPIYILLMITSIFFNWCFGCLIEKVVYRKLILSLALIVNITILIIFKYLNLIAEVINLFLNTNIIFNVALPVGVSFFTFQAMSYVIDVYKKDCKPSKNIINLALYISFFPQLIAGPILKYKEINHQINEREVSINRIYEGIRKFIYGFAKKILIANILAFVIDKIILIDVHKLTWQILWFTIISYSFQIYYDFSGYSDMAIGLGEIFGFKFSENFNYPYISTSITDFWRRWHISLSSWFKEYVYIPLGGNRISIYRTLINLFIVFFLTGLWHGASINFIVWGVYHAFFIIIEKIINYQTINRYLKMIYSYFIVTIGWIFFRIDGFYQSMSWIKMMFFPWTNKIIPEYSIFEFIDKKTILILFCAFIGSGLLKSIENKNHLLKKWKDSYFEQIYLTILLILSILQLASNAYNPFIYFRF